MDELEEDDILKKVQEESLRYYEEVELPRIRQEVPEELLTQESTPNKSLLSTQVLRNPGTLLYDGEEAKGFYITAGSTYIYPTNYPIRQYQMNIVKSALFKNTLVSLPTGLGKTFIAAVVMYNYYRWYPCGKVIFMAPTRPLVAQQIKACHHIMNIPNNDTTEMTGTLNVQTRALLWKEKRVFFLTPQVMVNDLRSNICPISHIKCLVVDEAHRAVKDYAYCQVVKLLEEANIVYRILALSATPGNDMNAVQQVIKNLKISTLEFRGEDALDVSPYTHTRSVESCIVEPSINIQRVKQDFLQVYDKYAKKLKDFKALPNNISMISKFQVLKACEKFRANPPRGAPPSVIGSVIGDFTVCMSMAHALELLQIYGLRAFFNYLKEGGSDKSKAAATRLHNDQDLKKILDRLDHILSPLPSSDGYIWGHPKYQKMVSVLCEHFKKSEAEGESTRAIIFCEYRVVVSEVVELLNTLGPNIRPVMFVGQSGGKDRGMPQAKQLQMMKGFRSGEYNCLVATCVAEEGLDIGDVDLIILVEAHKSITRLVQRMGRTGRKRKGRCVVLLTKGKEENKFKEAMASRKSYISNIINSRMVQSSLFQDFPRMLPPGVKPEKELVHINPDIIVTPVKPPSKKQIDIRQCLVPAELPFISKEEFQEVVKELETTNLSFDKIPSQFCFYWDRVSDKRIETEELLKKDVNFLSDCIDWNREEQMTFGIEHSRETKAMCEILSKAGKINFLEEGIEKVHQLGSVSGKLGEKQKVSDNLEELNEEDLPKANRKIEKKNKKEVLKKACSMDIRQCMARAAGKMKPTKIDSEDDDCMIVLSPEIGPSSNFIVDDIIVSIKKKLNIGWIEEYDVLIHSDEIKCSFSKEKEMNCLLEKYMIPKPRENINWTSVTIFPDIGSFCNDLKEENIEKLDFSFIVKSCTKSQHNLSNTTLISSPDKHNSPPVHFENWEKEDDFLMEQQDEFSDDFVGIDELFNEARIEISENELDLDVHTKTNDLKEQKFSQKNDFSLIKDKSPKTNSKISFEQDTAVMDEKVFSKDCNDYNSFKVEDLWEETPHCLEKVEGNKDNLKSPELSDEEEWIVSSQENILGSLTGNVGGFSQVPFGFKTVISSTPKNSKSSAPSVGGVEKLTKRSLLPVYSKLEPETKSTDMAGTMTTIVDDDDVWNLSDLFEENCNEKNNETIIHNATTLIGITQLVDMIEKDKNEDKSENLLNETNNHSNENASLISNRSHIESDIVSSEVENKDVSKDPAIPNSSLLDVDDDIFVDMDDLFEKDNVSTSKSENSICKVKEKTIDSGTQIQMKTETIELDESDIISVNERNCSKVKNFKKFSSSKKKLTCERIALPVTSSYQVPLVPICGNNTLSIPLRKRGLSLKHKPIISISSKSTETILTNKSDKLTDESERFDFEIIKNKEGKFKSPVGLAKFNTLKNVNTSGESKEEENDQSRVIVQRKVRKRKALFSELDDDEIFKTSSLDMSLKISPIVQRKKQRRRNLEKQAGCLFIEDEANESGTISTDDEDNSSLDELDESFIDDKSPELDIRSRYLQSIKSPMVGKFKIPERKDYPLDVYSQVVTDHNSEYINDSFCVDSDEDSTEQDPSILELAEKKLAERRYKDKQRKCKLSPTSESFDESFPVFDISDDEIEKSDVPHKRKFLASSSSSESDQSVTKDSKRKTKRFKRIKCLGSSD